VTPAAPEVHNVRWVHLIWGLALDPQGLRPLEIQPFRAKAAQPIIQNLTKPLFNGSQVKVLFHAWRPRSFEGSLPAP
jgi:hypothetical protein